MNRVLSIYIAFICPSEKVVCRYIEIISDPHQILHRWRLPAFISGQRLLTDTERFSDGNLALVGLFEQYSDSIAKYYIFEQSLSPLDSTDIPYYNMQHEVRNFRTEGFPSIV